VASNRRGTRSRWAQSTNNHMTRVNSHHGKFNTLRELADRCWDRGNKVNFCAVWDHGTIEFRQHHGSVDGTEIANWVQFVVNFVETSRELTGKNGSRPRSTVRSLTDNRRKVVRGLRRAGANGLTFSELGRLGGWTTRGALRAVNSLAKAGNLDIERIPGTRRMRIRRRQSPGTFQDSGPLQGLTGPVNQHFQRLSQNRRAA
jgi:hypothetical protein